MVEAVQLHLHSFSWDAKLIQEAKCSGPLKETGFGAPKKIPLKGISTLDRGTNELPVIIQRDNFADQREVLARRATAFPPA